MHLVNIDRDKLVAAAGGDPWQVYATFEHGRPAQIAAVAQSFHDAGQSATDADIAFAQARQRFDAGWHPEIGEPAMNHSSPLRCATNALGGHAGQLPAIAVGLANVAAVLAEAQRCSAGGIAQLEKQLEQVDEDLGKVIDLEKDALLTDEQRLRVGVEIRGLDRKAIDGTAATWQQVVHIRDGYAGALRDAERTLRTHGYHPAFVNAPKRPHSRSLREPAVPIPVSETTPEVAHRWWNSLSPEQRAELTAAHSPVLGNLNGVPVDVRDEVNRAVMTDDLNRVRDVANLHGVSVIDIVRAPTLYELSAIDMTRYTNARRAEQGLAASAESRDELNVHPAVFLLSYQPDAFGGDGAAAIAMGNPDTAANTAVLVKGLGSGVKQGTLANPDGVRLYDEANRADWSKETAVVMWVGYDAPNAAADPGLYEPNMARTGGEALAADVNALAVTHQGPPTHMTVAGHSYGSTTVSDAAARFGMHANDVVLVGSPGTDLAHCAADFHLSSGGHLYVGDASHDQVSWFGEDTIKTPFGGIGLGQDPAMDGYGSVRFKAEVPGHSLNPFYEHSHYFDLGSESLFSIGDVVSGHGDALQRDGMTARHRGEFGLPSFAEPEAWREATTGHGHSAPTG